MKNRNKAPIILLIVFCLSVMGFYQASKISEGLEPRVDTKLATIFIATPGLAADVVESEIVLTLENELRSLPHVKDVYSIAHHGYAVISLELGKAATDSPKWLDKCRGVLHLWKGKYHHLHPYIQDPVLTMEPKIGYDTVVMAPYKNLTELKNELSKQSEVRDIRLLANSEKQIIVEFDNEDLDASKLHPLLIKDIIGANNTWIPGGTTHEKKRLYSIQSQSALQSIDDLKELEVRDPRNNDPTALEDVVNIYESIESKYDAQAYLGDKRQVVLAIRKEPNTKAADFSKLVQGITEKYEGSVFLQNNPTIQKQKNAILWGAICSILIAFIIISLTIGVREAFVISLSIPVVIGISSLFISLTAVTINIISLAAIILSLSLIIDGHIVVVDACNRKKRSVRNLIRRFGSVLAVSVLTTIVSFSPIYFADHVLAEYLGDMFVVLVITLIVSLFYCCFVTPHLLTNAGVRNKSKLARLSRWHHRFLEKVSVMKGRVIIAAAIILAIGIGSMNWVPKAFFPEQRKDYQVLTLLCKNPKTNSELKVIAQEVTSELGLETPKYFLGMESPSLSAFQEFTPHDMRLISVIVPNDFSIDQCEALEKKHAAYQFELHKATVGPKIKYALNFEIQGNDEEVESFLKDFSKLAQKEEGIKHLVHVPERGHTSLDVKINPKNDGDFSRQDVALTLRLNTQGLPITSIVSEGQFIPVILKAESNHANPKTSLENSYVFSKNKKVPALMLHEIASVSKVKTRLQGSRVNGDSVALAPLYLNQNVSAKVARHNVLKSLKELQAEHPNVSVKEHGQTHASSKATQAILDVMPWVIFILVTLLLLREWSIKRVIIIFSVLPFAFAGGHIGLLICGQSQGFMSLIGTVSLFGIVINNAILWLDALQNQSGTENRYIHATMERFRAITVTSLCGVATLLPLYWFGGDIWKPLAATLIFGLILSYIAIVVILPVIAEAIFGKHGHDDQPEPHQS